MRDTDKEREIQQLVSELSRKLGKNPAAVKKNAQSGNIENLLDNMDKKQADKIKGILNDEEKTRQLMNNPQVQALIRKLTGDN